jgi:hypothetical protein
MPCLHVMLREHDARLQGPVDELHRATTLFELVRRVWIVVRVVAVCLLEERLRTLAETRQTWPLCGVCGRRLRSRGLAARQLITLFGEIH